MLISLNVSNIALIGSLSVQFYNGLHALTGETGAGKSILIDSIGLLLGAKSSKELIRDGEKRAFVEGVFDISDCDAARSFLEREQALPEGNELTLSREITESGRSVCRVDGLVWQLGQYQQLTSCLMDLHGQHAHQSLMDDRNHLAFLDAYGGKEHEKLLHRVSEAYELWHEAEMELKKTEKKSFEKTEQMDFLAYQKKELENAHLVRGEESELSKERDMYRNADKIGTRLETAYDDIYAAAPAAFQQVREAAGKISDIAHLDDRFSVLSSRLNSVYYELEDIGLTLRDLKEEIPSDPQRLEEVEERLDLIRRLSRKYGATTDDMLNKLEEINASLQSFTDLDGLLFDLSKKEEAARKEYNIASSLLTESRKKISVRFERAMEEQLCDLNMAGTRFVVQFISTEPSSSGSERACFMIAPNRGEKLQSLSKTASGGELSRLMLAIKSVGMQTNQIPSMIFDEIDTGISGRTAQKVAEKMRALADGRQVLCVTHLQQIAAMASYHYLVEKGYDGERTSTSVRLLTSCERIDEIARILGGDIESARIHAAEMLAVNQD